MPLMKVFANLANALIHIVRNNNNAKLDVLYMILKNIFKTVLAIGHHDVDAVTNKIYVDFTVTEGYFQSQNDSGQPQKYMGK